MAGMIESALTVLDVSQLTRAEWIAVGMALKEEGYPCAVWDEWSKNDSRYHAGECERVWRSFKGSSSPVKGGTIVQMARERGWVPYNGEDACMSWDDTIEYDGDGVPTGYSIPLRTPVEELIEYLTLLFEEDEHVSYVTNEAWQNEDGKWVPGRGPCDRTAGELIASLKKHPDDLGATIGDWKPQAGAWIRFNPVDGKGGSNENVTRFHYALVESDNIPVTEQYAVYQKLDLPIIALVQSGGKSLHAIVRVDAANAEEYRKRVDFLYDYLDKHGCPVDHQNRNESRLSRMPGVTRNGNRQALVATNIGRKSWADWMDFVEGASDELPDMVSLSDYREEPPELPEELISGILRRGHKMLISGSSKAGKSFLLMELCIAIAEGTKWLGFDCRQGKVLYVNLEIDPASCINRFLKIYDALGMPMKNSANITIWNLRGHAVPLDQLVPKLIRRVRDQHYDAIVIDPIYKVITGDENNASEMGAFCNQFDKICTELGCATIYCHHHSKGLQGQKRAMDRASGSGVFARDPDAQLDMVELELPEDVKNNVRDGSSSGWRLESSLREFANIMPVNFWFEYPIHRVDSGETLCKLPAQGSAEAGRIKNSHAKTTDTAADEFRMAYAALNLDGKVSIKDMAEYLGVIDKTVYARLKRMSDEFFREKGFIYRVEGTASDTE